jgi:hypothetical protein
VVAQYVWLFNNATNTNEDKAAVSNVFATNMPFSSRKAYLALVAMVNHAFIHISCS